MAYSQREKADFKAALSVVMATRVRELPVGSL
jgi:hypothetical protein